MRRSAGRGIRRSLRLPGSRRLKKFDGAYRLAQQAQPYLGDDPVLAERMAAISGRADISSNPPGATVFYRPYNSPAEPWRPLGRTPVAGAQVPRGLLHWKAEMADREVAEDVAGIRSWESAVKLQFSLFRPDQTPPGMVRIPSSTHGRADCSCPGSITFPRSTCPITGLTVTRSRIASSSGSWTMAATAGQNCGGSHS